jgi:hypothetical protein
MEQRRARRPALEPLEVRDLLSTLSAPKAPARPGRVDLPAAIRTLAHRSAVESQLPGAANGAHIDSPNGLVGKGPPGPFLNPRVIEQFASLLYGPASPTPMTPTASEIKRQTFTGRWVGEYTVGPPRFSDRAGTIHVWSKTGGSNQFLKGKLDMALFPPANPGATPDPGNPYANQLTGVVGLFNQNLLQSGGVLVLDINGTNTPSANPLALPEHLVWTYDNNTSAGPYAAPVLFVQGGGTLDLKWIPDAHPLPGTMGSGKVIATFQGLINTSQIVSAVSKSIS